MGYLSTAKQTTHNALRNFLHVLGSELKSIYIMKNKKMIKDIESLKQSKLAIVRPLTLWGPGVLD